MPSSDAARDARVALHRLFWRVHFWAGMITAPLVLFAALTGLLYVFTPQIEARVHARLDRVPVRPVVRPLDEQVAAAAAALPDAIVRSVVPGDAPGDTTQVLFARPRVGQGEHALHAAAPVHLRGLPQGRIVYVDPYSAEVVGSLAETARFKTWARALHSSMLQGESWRWPIELAASWMLLMFATGITMWWPRSSAQGGPGWRALVPRFSGGRANWRDLHTSVGVLMSTLLVVVLVTGLTWSRHAGDNFRAAQQALHQNSPRPPTDLPALAGAEARQASLQQLFDTARAEFAAAGLGEAPLQLAPPSGAQAHWRVDALVRNDPTQRLTLLLDTRTAQVRYRSAWSDLPLLAKATAVGIPFHRAELGVWNQCLIAAAAIAAIFALLSGVVMWWKRRPAQGVGAPVVSASQLRTVPPILWALTTVLAVALPAFGISLAAFVGVELAAALWRRRSATPASV